MDRDGDWLEIEVNGKKVFSGHSIGLHDMIDVLEILGISVSHDSSVEFN